MIFDPRIEPVRGSYPPPGLLSLPGEDRVGAGPDSKIPPPPIRHLFGMHPTEHPGTQEAVFAMPASPWLQSHAGVFLASTTALVADAPLGSCIHRQLPPGRFGTTSQLSMSFQRPATPDSGMLTAHARSVDVGTSMGLSEATVTDGQGRLLSILTSRYYLITLDDPPTPPASWDHELPTYDSPDPFERPLPEHIVPKPRSDVDGLDLVRAQIDGAVAPYQALFGIRPTEAAEGRFAMTAPASEWFCSPSRAIYGGILALFADAAMINAAVTTIPAGSACATLDLTLHFLRPALPTGEDLTTTAEVVHRGRSLIVANTQIRNAAGKVVVMGNGSLRVMEGRAWDAAFEPFETD